MLASAPGENPLSFIPGTPRSDVLLFPEAIDDYVSDDNPVRFIEAFVDNLDLQSARLFSRYCLLTPAGLLTVLPICSNSTSMVTSIALALPACLSESARAISNSSG